jgi:hypothetical protein
MIVHEILSLSHESICLQWLTPREGSLSKAASKGKEIDGLTSQSRDNKVSFHGDCRLESLLDHGMNQRATDNPTLTVTTYNPVS